MRVIIYTRNGIVESQTAALALQDMGYDALAYNHLYEPGYRAPGCSPQGFRASGLQVLQNLVVELIAGTVIAIHPLCDPADVAELAPVCRFLNATLVALEALPTRPPANDEEVDAFRSGRCAAPTKKVRPVVQFTNTVLEIDGNGEVIEPSRGLRERLHDVRTRCQRWLARVDRQLTGLKNPMTRQAMEQRGQAPPVEYPKASKALSTTG